LAEGIPARLTPAEGRKFGLTVGLAFLVLGGISHWRGHNIAPYVMWALGGSLTLGGLVAPVALSPVHKAWMGFAHQLSRVTTPLFMGLVYFVVLTPIGWVVRLVSRNPLQHAAGAAGYWRPRADGDQRSTLGRQF
jgi:hypothetical protein